MHYLNIKSILRNSCQVYLFIDKRECFINEDFIYKFICKLHSRSPKVLFQPFHQCLIPSFQAIDLPKPQMFYLICEFFSRSTNIKINRNLQMYINRDYLQFAYNKFNRYKYKSWNWKRVEEQENDSITGIILIKSMVE